MGEGPGERAGEKKKLHPLIRRLPLLLVALAGLWFFQSRGTERTVIWKLPPDVQGVTEVEFQLRDPEGALVKRERQFFPQGPPEQVTLKVKLPEGTYQAEVYLVREGAETVVRRRAFRLEGESVWVDLEGA